MVICLDFCNKYITKYQNRFLIAGYYVGEAVFRGQFVFSVGSTKPRYRSLFNKKPSSDIRRGLLI